MIGTRLGSYEITAKLGEGGMGEVYRAHDTKLKRDVAIKVLPQEFTADKERLARFEREAQLLAQLNHPNIAAIHTLEKWGQLPISGVGSNESHAEGKSEAVPIFALVMELVEGPTLAERLEQGPFSFDECLSVCVQIAHALEEAHEKGIVHRDLKPQNIKASIEGKTKVLDFGLAKAMDPAAGSAASTADMARSPTLMQSPTLTAMHGTQLGVILGTAAYMAPEQAKGLPIDKRADIWAFGVVMYEMLVGRSLFAGDTVTDTLAGVLKTEIDFSKLPAETPAAIRRLLRRCLERSPKNRLHDIADARLVLEDVAAGRVEEGRPGSEIGVEPAPRSGAARWLPWVAALVGVAVGVAGWLRPAPSSLPAAPAVALTRFVVPPPAAGELVGFPALAPDGRTMAFCFAAERDVPRLWLHSFVSGESRVVPGSDLAEHPFWSPDGRRIGFMARGQLRSLDVATGHLDALAPASDSRGASWSESGEIVFAPTCCAGLSAVASGGGPVRAATRLDPGAGETSHRFPWMLPGGEALLFTIPDGESSGVHFARLAGGPTQRLLPQTARAVFDRRGFLLWLRDGSVVAQRFDPASGALSGEIFLAASAVGTDTDKTAQDLFGAAAGVVAFRPPDGGGRELRWIERSGAPAQLVASGGFYYDPALSLDQRRVVVARSTTPNYFESDLWVFETTGTDRASRLTFEGGATAPSWSADGLSVFQSTEVGGAYRVVRRRADGSGGEELLYESPTALWIDAVSPRDPLMVLEGTASDGSYKLFLLPLSGAAELRPFQHESAGSQTHASFSPDGRLLAYTSDESGLPQVYVQSIDGSSGRWQVSRDGGDLATWRAEGGELYFVGLDRVLRAVPLRSLTPFAAGDEIALTPLRIPPIAITSQHAYYLPSADGRRFLVNQSTRARSEAGIHVLLGWSPLAADGARP